MTKLEEKRLTPLQPKKEEPLLGSALPGLDRGGALDSLHRQNLDSAQTAVNVAKSLHSDPGALNRIRAEMLNEPDPDSKIARLHGVYGANKEAGIQTAKALLEDPRIAARAFVALFKFSPEEALKSLGEMLNSTNSGVRHTATLLAKIYGKSESNPTRN